MSESVPVDVKLDDVKNSENKTEDLFFTQNGTEIDENDEDEIDMIKIELYSDFDDDDDNQLTKSDDPNSCKTDPNTNRPILEQFKNQRSKVPIEVRRQIIG